MDDAAFDDATNDRPDEGDGECVIDVEFEGCIGIVVPVVRKDVEKSTNEVE